MMMTKTSSLGGDIIAPNNGSDQEGSLAGMPILLMIFSKTLSSEC